MKPSKRWDNASMCRRRCPAGVVYRCAPSDGRRETGARFTERSHYFTTLACLQLGERGGCWRTMRRWKWSGRRLRSSAAWYMRSTSTERSARPCTACTPLRRAKKMQSRQPQEQRETRYP